MNFYNILNYSTILKVFHFMYFQAKGTKKER